jgi:hypothetical protein
VLSAAGAVGRSCRALTRLTAAAGRRAQGRVRGYWEAAEAAAQGNAKVDQDPG